MTGWGATTLVSAKDVDSRFRGNADYSGANVIRGKDFRIPAFPGMTVGSSGLLYLGYGYALGADG